MLVIKKIFVGTVLDSSVYDLIYNIIRKIAIVDLSFFEWGNFTKSVIQSPQVPMSDLLRLSALYELYSFIKIYVDKCSFKVPSPDNKIFYFYLENYVNKTLFYKHQHLKILNFLGVGVSSYHVPGEAYGRTMCVVRRPSQAILRDMRPY